MPAPKIADIWNLTPAEMDGLLRHAAWLVRYPEAATLGERHEVQQHLMRVAKQVNPSAYSSMDGAAEYYRPGVYNGD